MACGSLVVYLALGFFLCCGAVAPYYIGTFDDPSWPSPRCIVDVWDVNASFIGSLSNLTITYDGQPFFLRFRNVSGGGEFDFLQFDLSPAMLAHFSSFFPSDDATYYALHRIKIPHIINSRFKIREAVIYYERFVYDDLHIPISWVYSVSYDYGDK